MKTRVYAKLLTAECIKYLIIMMAVQHARKGTAGGARS